MNRLEGKVAFITGAARGQGRSHAIRLAEEGADIIAVDICRPLEGCLVPAAPEDLADTVKSVEALDRRIVAIRADVRDETALATAVAEGIAILGHIDIVVANAGVSGGLAELAAYEAAEFRGVIETNVVGVFLTAKVTIPFLRQVGPGASLVLISSTLGLRGGPNCSAYSAAKHAVVGLMKTLAIELAPDGIRVNSIHPTCVDTPMIHNRPTYRAFRPDLANPTTEEVRGSFRDLNLLDVPWIQPRDVSEALLHLVSESGRYVTGTTMTVDAGWITK